ncbi:MAG: hypothetical protein K6V36_14335 [Anaerolineae bacterium]|nr:hypothetical protein [Anaerolineae bacterium]
MTAASLTILADSAEQICAFMQLMRDRDFYKRPGVAETIDWGQALVTLHREALDPAVVEETLGCIFKYNDDINAFRALDVNSVVGQAVAGVRPG